MHFDWNQFSHLSDELANCYPANLKVLRNHLDLALKSKPQSLFLYITSHGSEPISQSISDPKRSKHREHHKEFQKKYPSTDQFELVLNATPDGDVIENLTVHKKIKQGAPEQDWLLTPKQLQTILKPWGEIPKVIVLQGCYSGGFIKTKIDRLRQDLLTHLPKITVLTASDSTVSSFGCQSGVDETVFGEKFNSELGKQANKSSPIPSDRLTYIYGYVVYSLWKVEKRFLLRSILRLNRTASLSF